MKTLVKAIFAILLSVLSLQVNAQKSTDTKTITYQCSFDCPSCEAKVMKNLPYEKGVKNVEVKYDQKLVTVEYKTTKNTDEGIKIAIEKLGYEVKIPDTVKSFHVKGNCGMCKSNIENAAKSINGVSVATWDSEKQLLEVAFDVSLTNLDEIQSAVAAVGYDTDKIKAKDEVYNSLHSCCKYDR